MPPAAATMSAVAAAPTFLPLYRQIKSLVLRRLEAGDWKPGEAIPSEGELAARYGVSQGTVRKAIDELAAENVLVRRQGRGTFVGTHGEPRQQFRFLRLAPDRGAPGPYASRAFECRRGRASAEAARLLELKPGGAIVAIRRVLLFGGEPIVLEDITLPGALFKGLTAARLAEHESASIYHLYETDFGTRMIRADERLKATTADASAARLLGVAEGTPLLSVDRIAFTYGDRPVEWRRGLYRTDKHHYANALY